MLIGLNPVGWLFPTRTCLAARHRRTSEIVSFAINIGVAHGLNHAAVTAAALNMRGSKNKPLPRKNPRQELMFDVSLSRLRITPITKNIGRPRITSLNKDKQLEPDDGRQR